MSKEKDRFQSHGSSSGAGRAERSRATLWAGSLVALVCLSGSAVFAEPFTYTHVIGTDDPAPSDLNKPMVEVDKTIAACDIGILTDSGLMSNVCSFDGDKNSDGGVYIVNNKGSFRSFRSFRREDHLPGQDVSFENSVIPFGFPALHPTTGDTYVTAFFNTDGEDAGLPNSPGGPEKGVYVYNRKSNVMNLIADTTPGSPSPPDLDDPNALWTDFSTNVAVSEAGAFFVGDYSLKAGNIAGQGIYRYDDGKLIEVVGNPGSTDVPGHETTFSKYRAVAANSSTVLFVGESCAEDGDCIKGVYAQPLENGSLSTVIESGVALPDGGILLDFAVEPETGIYHSSIAVNDDAGDIVLVASYQNGQEKYQGVFLLKKSGGAYTPTLILRSGVTDHLLLNSKIESFNTVAINERSEIAFAVANGPEQGLVFYRNATEGLRSVFKQGDTFLAELIHPSSPDYNTKNHGGMVAGSQALDSSLVPRIYFRHAYMIDEKVYSMMVIATLNKP